MSQMHTVKGIATTVKTDNKGTIVVRYHETDVVVVRPNGRITLNTGGWKTATTRTRMNQASNQFSLGFHVYQRNYKWFVEYQGKTLEFDGSSIVLGLGVQS